MKTYQGCGCAAQSFFGFFIFFKNIICFFALWFNLHIYLVCAMLTPHVGKFRWKARVNSKAVFYLHKMKMKTTPTPSHLKK